MLIMLRELIMLILKAMVEIELFMLSYFIGGGLEYSLGGNTALVGGIYFTSGILDVTSNSNNIAQISSLALRIGVKF